jgi:hypothetical protein
MYFMRSKAITLCVINVGDLIDVLLTMLVKKQKGNGRVRPKGNFQINHTANGTCILKFKVEI